MARFEIRLSGSGGQGMITAGIILANAAAIEEGKKAVQSQSYGPEARGGASKAEVIISDEDVNYPKVTAPDILVALTQEAYNKYSTDIKKGALVVIDTAMVKEFNQEGEFKIYKLPIINTVTDELGSSLSANIATVGAVNEICKIMDEAKLLKTVLKMIPRGTEEVNEKAFKIGIRLARDAK